MRKVTQTRAIRGSSQSFARNYRRRLTSQDKTQQHRIDLVQCINQSGRHPSLVRDDLGVDWVNYFNTLTGIPVYRT